MFRRCSGNGLGECWMRHTFNRVISQFGLMFFRDRHKALRETMRVLTPDGRMAIAVWDSLDNSEAYSIEVALLERLAGRQAAEALRAPFVLGNRAELARLFQKERLSSSLQRIL